MKSRPKTDCDASLGPKIGYDASLGPKIGCDAYSGPDTYYDPLIHYFWICSWPCYIVLSYSAYIVVLWLVLGNEYNIFIK